ncbi:hypothetical protein D3C72_767970 [compost metagenome]
MAPDWGWVCAAPSSTSGVLLRAIMMRSARLWGALPAVAAAGAAATGLGCTTGSGRGGGSGRVTMDLGSTRTKGGVTTSFTSICCSSGLRW